MKALKAVIDQGRITLQEPLNITGRHDAIVVVLDLDPWEAIVQDPRPRPELTNAREQAKADFAQ
jgi:hypothetical protein